MSIFLKYKTYRQSKLQSTLIYGAKENSTYLYNVYKKRKPTLMSVWLLVHVPDTKQDYFATSPYVKHKLIQ